MALDLEIIDYDLEGAAYRDGAVVDAAYLIATVRRRPQILDGKVVTPTGDATKIRVHVSDLAPADRSALFDAFGRLEAIVKSASEDHVRAAEASPKALDAQIQAAANAARERDAAIEAKRAAEEERAKLDAEIAAKRAELEQLQAQPQNVPLTNQ